MTKFYKQEGLTAEKRYSGYKIILHQKEFIGTYYPSRNEFDFRNQYCFPATLFNRLGLLCWTIRKDYLTSKKKKK